MTEQQPYQIEQKFADFEVRRYPEHLLAEVVIDGSFEDAGNRAFRYLFSYISGENRSNREVAMTAPVVQDAASEKIQMTSPVVQQGMEDASGRAETNKFRVAFVLPEGFTLENAPQPTSSQVQLRVVPEARAAVIRFSGRWSTESYRRHLEELRAAVDAAGITCVGPPRFAKFDPPFKPWFMRRNEIMLDLDDSSPAISGH
ncbi:heme-binding protein [Arthrobacter sp.]|uniref:SOUL family heme-binding protein n=1 Tax=Arthrobacter sp. TaxID=1667 RepID=UPI0026E0A679|nr:heme-binding protein [Arthrobacter sp.]MDO5754552.1 heme-binding protein [Arthrobacter sp.]